MGDAPPNGSSDLTLSASRACGRPARFTFRNTTSLWSQRWRAAEWRSECCLTYRSTSATACCALRLAQNPSSRGAPSSSISAAKVRDEWQLMRSWLGWLRRSSRSRLSIRLPGKPSAPGVPPSEPCAAGLGALAAATCNQSRELIDPRGVDLFVLARHNSFHPFGASFRLRNPDRCTESARDRLPRRPRYSCWTTRDASPNSPGLLRRGT